MIMFKDIDTTTVLTYRNMKICILFGGKKKKKNLIHSIIELNMTYRVVGQVSVTIIAIIPANFKTISKTHNHK